MMFLTGSLFFATLSNHSGITIPLALFFAFCFLAYLKFRFDNFYLPSFVWFYISAVFVVVEGLLFQIGIPEYKSAPEFNEAFLNNFIKYFILIFLLYVYAVAIRNSPSSFLKSCFLVLIFHIVVFYIQFIFAYFLGYYIDFVLPFTGEASRFRFYGLASISSLYRCTGLFVEPSTYAASIYCLILIIKFNPKYNGGLDKYLKLAFLSIALTLSTLSILILLLHLFFANLHKFLKIKSLLSILVFLVVSIALIPQTEIYQVQSEKASSTSSIRFNLIDFVLNRDESLLVFGSGLFGIEKTLISGSEAACGAVGECTSVVNRQLASPADNGILFYLFIKFGVASFLILLFVFYPLFLSRKLDRIGYVFVLLLTKLQFAFPLIWIFILVMRGGNENSSDNALVKKRWG
ncbi:MULTISPECIES: hypothetical protein [unclassified Marinobacterium]|uniref:hypothetical protein n=1 Tax=unclassified Marinobacterium TaxID=2644139 RepID=UPI0015691375|nr:MULTISPECIES: hypothetical protein [unclassified Marinobacterium]NRP09212.1 hypothetical protein [Marinobacterium sp. xm-g-48]NRP82257.1 hypothetical protein [Marinobacterium sp. xm-d-509]